MNGKEGVISTSSTLSPAERTEEDTETHTRRGHPYRGLLYHIDGQDGCGKSSQIALLNKYLESQGYDFVSVRDPGGTKASDMIRNILLNTGDIDISPRVELLLFEASRGQLVDEKIKPALELGKIVTTDRYESSTTAYQGAGGKIPLEFIWFGNRIATDGIYPDRSVFLDVPYEESLRRRGKDPDRMERKRRYFHERVREGYLGQAKLDPQRIIVIDGMQSAEEIHRLIVADFEKYIDEHKLRDLLLRKSPS